MWEQIEEWITWYCIGVMTVLMDFIDKVHPLISIGVPLLVTAGVQWFMPVWVKVALAVLVWIPAATGMTMLLVACWPDVRRRRNHDYQ